MRIRTRLMLAFVGCGVIPIAVVGYLNYRTAAKGMGNIQSTAATGFQERAQAQLVALRDVKKTQVQRYCADRRADLDALLNNVAAMRQTAFANLTGLHNARKAAIEAEFKQITTDIDVLATSDSVRQFVAKLHEHDAATQAAPDQPYDVSAPAYGEICTALSGPLQSYVRQSGCPDLYVVCAEHGHVMYTHGGKADRGTNLTAGPYKGEGLAKLWQKVRETQKTCISDFAAYSAADGQQMAFVGSPVSDAAGTVLGMVAAQVSADTVNRIVQSREGLGQTGETYVVGRADGQTSYRSDRVVVPGKIGEAAAGPLVDAAFGGKGGRQQLANAAGALELTCYAPLEIPGLDWVLLTSMSLEETLAPKVDGNEDVYTKFVKEYGYYDLYLIGPNGHCFYTVAHEKDYQSNLVDGPYKDSHLGRLVQKTLRDRQFGVADFAAYAPSGGAMAAFIAAPIVDNGQADLVVALQLSEKGLNEIMCSRAGLGETGCTYLVGLNADGQTAFRSDLTFMDPKYVLGSEITAPYIEKAFETADAEGDGMFKDSHGDDVVAAYTRVDFFGLNWGLFGKFNGSEALAAVDQITQIGDSANSGMLWWAVGAGLIVGVIVLCAGFYVSMQIVKPLRHTVNLLRDIAEGEGDLTRTLDASSKDELGELAHWFNEFVNKLRVLVTNVAGNSRSLNAASTQLSATATQLNSGAEETTRQATTVASATEEMSANMTSMAAATEQMTVNIKTVAAATEEMTASVAEIARNAEQASTIATGAAELAQVSNETIARLGTSADEIGKVIDVIQDIADQTNLLALNATIEAARAGAAGNGFAVVATEVKELARKTAEATEDIRHRIQGIQGSTAEAVQAIGKISQVIDEVKDVSRTIASAVEEQSITTREIAQNVAETSKAAETVSVGVSQSAVASTEISQTITGVDTAAKQTAQGAAQTHTAGDELLRLANELDALVNRFKT